MEVHMKTHHLVTLAAIFALTLICPQRASAQQGDMPITTSSKEALALFIQGRDKAENLEQTAAIPLFDQAIQKDPGFAMAHLARAQSAGNFNQFREHLGHAVSLAEKVSPGERHWILAAQAQADNDLATAKEHIDQLLKLFPADKRIQYQAGIYSRTIGDAKAGLAHLTKAAELDKTYAPAYNLIGYTHSELGDYTAAEAAFKTYIALLPNSPNPYDSHAELLLKTGRYDESIAQYRKALETDPSFILSYGGIGNNYIFKGEYAKARASYQQQFDKAPTAGAKLGALDLITASYMHEGNLAEALKANEQARALAEQEKLVPATLATYQTAAFLLAESGKPEEAAKLLEQANTLRGASSLPSAVKETGRIQSMIAQSRVLIARRQFDAAKAQLEKVRPIVEARKSVFEAREWHEALGHLELEQGKYDAALQHFSMANQEDPYVWYYMAVAHEKKGDKAGASKLYARVVNWNQNDLGYAVVRSRAMGKQPK
jgi:tetratricopeptide (TPR) repeat protein